MVTTRCSDQQGSKSRQKIMRLYKRWHRPITKRYIKPPLLHVESSITFCLFGDVAFSEYFLYHSFSLERTSYVLSFRVVFFYLATGWIFYISLLCEKSINRSINGGFLPNIILLTLILLLCYYHRGPEEVLSLQVMLPPTKLFYNLSPNLGDTLIILICFQTRWCKPTSRISRRAAIS